MKRKPKAPTKSNQHLPAPEAPAWKAAMEPKLEELRELEKAAFGSRHGKTDFYGYLKAIYNASDWTDPAESARVATRVASLRGIVTRKNKPPIAVVIDATSRQDRQVKSRWVQALEYAVAKGARGTGFIKFVEKNGGVSGCAQKMAALRKAQTAPERA
jgi:hypothetical protein